ncbi:hypothetical protein E4Z66_05645 [Aliishimia ponticola]|uniref:Uncharacterized protein n=1 Tax=Aliishimia ponticola TaxID=2499833 RepID=A0A4S4NL59_9RHOB|nr:hypothetical protein [Aliishimia ponticola]THH39041.1 hypothetical protein E4Z66_05645 [Aliishimia ponticola]
MSCAKVFTTAALLPLLCAAMPAAAMGPRADLDQFAICAGRFSAMATQRPADHTDFAARRGWFAELAEAARPNSVPADYVAQVELEAWAGFMVLLHTETASFNSNIAKGAARARQRGLAECERLIFG